jgi:hypothetical protein
MASLYPSLHYLNTQSYTPEKSHPNVQSVTSLPADCRRVGDHLRLVIGTCLLQAKRARYNQYEVDPTCVMCKSGPETSSHFLLECPNLNNARSSTLERIASILGLDDPQGTAMNAQIILDPTHHSVFPRIPPQKVRSIMREIRIMTQLLNLERKKQLLQLPTRKRHGLYAQ